MVIIAPVLKWWLQRKITNEFIEATARKAYERAVDRTKLPTVPSWEHTTEEIRAAWRDNVKIVLVALGVINGN
jgi:hypothetical protein